MQTQFSPAQLEQQHIRDADDILRRCVHCGFCTATCPTYVVRGDELDSPRGRIYLIKDMFEQDRTPSSDVVKHVDRCLSCLSCMTTCPSGVDYMHLVDLARERIEVRRADHVVDAARTFDIRVNARATAPVVCESEQDVGAGAGALRRAKSTAAALLAVR